jgi:D-alanine--poly(phosphoribitol) ligase subunit 1
MKRPYPYFAPHIFSDIVSRQPNNKALVWSTSEHTSFESLDKASNSIANYLLSKGVNKGDRVCLILDKYEVTYSLIIACLKIGAPYFNVDPANPIARTQYMLEKCDPKIIFSSKKLEIAQWESRNMVVPSGDNSWYAPFSNNKTDKNISLSGNDPAYIMFTSGSTGFPKGVTISHSNLAYFIDWAKWEYDITPQDVSTNVNPLYFDNSVFDIYSSLFNGGALIPFNAETIKDPIATLKKVNECGATLFFSVPSLLILFQTLKQVTSSSFSNTRKIIFGGEGYPKPKLKQLYDLLSPRVQLVNVYGPTECTCICSSYNITGDDFTDMTGYPPIGSLIPNFSFIVADENTRSVGYDTIGELCLGGPCVGLGYFNNPDLTEKAFVQNGENNLFHDRLYKTGDLVKHSKADNKIYFVGRKDSQIKHQGYRIELGEIEHALSKIKNVNEAVALHTNKSGLSMLIGIIASTIKPDETEFKKELAKYIPNYMVPSRIICMESLPKNQNGKIDRNLLKETYCK